MRTRGTVLLLLFIITGLLGLNSFTVKTKSAAVAMDEEGRVLFLRHCTVCHLTPDPAGLTKEIWAGHVLPVMAARMGIIYPNYDPFKGLSDEEQAIVKKHNIIPEEPVCTDADWVKIRDYIISNAPDSVSTDEKRLTRNSPLTQFVRQDVQIDNKPPSLITGLKYNGATKTLWIGNFDNQVLNWQYGKGAIKTIKSQGPVVDFNFYKNNTYFTQIGKLYPTELSTGSYAQLADTGVAPILTQLHRPVCIKINDLNNDGTSEIVVCNFGNKLGSLSLFKKNKAGKYIEDVLLPLPGAIKCYIKDMNGDGKKDIVAMFSQGGRERLYILSKGQS
ncbi:FG-GAP-like repeat-containing protein [Mucilaginibacter sp. UC70_90]